MTEKSITGGEVEELKRMALNEFMKGRSSAELRIIAFDIISETFNILNKKGHLKTTSVWLPIESAPRDGTEIIVLQTSGNVQRVKYIKDEASEFEGWVDFQEEDSYWTEEYFVKWMIPPLPQPPEVKE